jgi:hypothetical protein
MDDELRKTKRGKNSLAKRRKKEWREWRSEAES